MTRRAMDGLLEHSVPLVSDNAKILVLEAHIRGRTRGRVPEIGAAVVVAPQDVGLAVAVEVAGVLRCARSGRRCRQGPGRLSARPPSISQMATRPLSLRHRMSALPSPLKSPASVDVPVVPMLPTRRWPGRRSRAVHLPDADRAVVVAPQDVGLAVAVEVAGAGDVPVVADSAESGA